MCELKQGTRFVSCASSAKSWVLVKMQAWNENGKGGLGKCLCWPVNMTPLNYLEEVHTNHGFLCFFLFKAVPGICSVHDKLEMNRWTKAGEPACKYNAMEEK